MVGSEMEFSCSFIFFGTATAGGVSGRADERHVHHGGADAVDHVRPLSATGRPAAAPQHRPHALPAAHRTDLGRLHRLRHRRLFLLHHHHHHHHHLLLLLLLLLFLLFFFDALLLVFDFVKELEVVRRAFDLAPFLFFSFYSVFFS